MDKLGVLGDFLPPSRTVLARCALAQKSGRPTPDPLREVLSEARHDPTRRGSHYEDKSIVRVTGPFTVVPSILDVELHQCLDRKGRRPRYRSDDAESQHRT